MEHINESILSEEIKEHQKEARIDHMVYLPGMEALKSDITKQVVEAMQKWKKKIILAIRSVFLRRSILPIIVKIIVSTAGLTVITVSAGQN